MDLSATKQTQNVGGKLFKKMRQTRITILLSLLTVVTYGQVSDFDLKKIKFKGLEFSTTKQTIIKTFGQSKIVDTDYECGFFTNDQPGGPYYQMVYPEFTYIGSDKEKFYLQQVNFDSKGQIIIKYGDKDLSGLTTVEQFCKIIGDTSDNIFQKPDRDSVLIYSKDSDDGAIFTFKNGRLIKFEYWTPC